MIRAQDLSKIYRHAETLAVDHIAFSLKSGEIAALVGPNGAGKSTVIRMLTGSMTPSSGNVICTGSIGYLPEQPPLYDDLLVEEYLRFIGQLKNLGHKAAIAAAIDAALNRTNLQHKRRQLISSLSKGYRQRLGLAQAILGNPDILLLDEPTAGLDPLQVATMRTLLQELAVEHTVLLSTHILHEVARICSRVLLMNHGRIIADASVDTLIHTHGSLESAFVQLTSSPHTETQAVQHP